MRILGTVRLNHSYKADICKLQCKFLGRSTDGAQNLDSEKNEYGWIRIEYSNGGSSDKYIDLAICHHDLYIRGVRNTNASFFLPTFTGLKAQGDKNCTLKIKDDSYRSFGLGIDFQWKRLIEFENKTEKDLHFLDKSKVLAMLDILERKHYSTDGKFEDVEKRALGYCCIIVSEAIRNSAIRTYVATIFDDAHIASRISLRFIMREAHQWGNKSESGDSATIVASKI